MAAIPLISETTRLSQFVAGQKNNNFVRAAEYNKLVTRVNSFGTEDGVITVTGDISVDDITVTDDATIQGDLAVTGTSGLTGAVSVTGTTASTSTTTGILIISGGVGIAKELFVSTTTPFSVSATGVVTVTNATDSTTKDTGSVILEGGIGIEKAVVIGTTLTVNGASTHTGVTTLGGVVQAPVFVADATPYTVLAANSGKMHIILEQTSNITLNLPAIAAGLSYKFIMGGVATEAQDWIIVATTPSFYNGGVVWLDSDDADDNIAPVYGNGTSHLTLTATKPEAGTCIEIYSNGTEWFVHGTVSSVDTPAFS